VLFSGLKSTDNYFIIARGKVKVMYSRAIFACRTATRAGRLPNALTPSLTYLTAQQRHGQERFETMSHLEINSHQYFRASQSSWPLVSLAAIAGITLTGATVETQCDGSPSEERIIRRAEVEAHSSMKSGVWVTYEDGVYDVTDFLSSHPGGKAKLMLAAGKDLKQFWRQPAFRLHFHSPLVTELLSELRIGTLHRDDIAPEPSRNEKRVLHYPNNQIYDCIVIGAGVSGLQCAKALTADHGLNKSDVLVLEAQDYIGGRVRQMTEFVKGVNIDVGAEFLHGDHTELTKLAKKYDEPISQIYCWAHGDGGPLQYPVNGEYGLYYVRDKRGDKPRLLRYDDKDEDFVRLNETLWGLAKEDPSKYTDADSLHDYLAAKGLSEPMMEMANAGFSNTLCTNSKDLSLKRAIKWENLWHGSGDDDEFECDFSFKGSFKVVVDHLKEDVQVELNSPVKNIEYSSSSSAQGSLFSDLVKLTTADGFTYYAKAVVVTSSPHVLKSGLVNFSPPLPPSFMEAIQGVNMRNIVKIVMKFSEPVWPKDLKGMIMVDENFVFPEVWFRDVKNIADADEPAKAYAVAFTTSEYAERLAALPRHEALKRCVGQLDSIFSLLEPRHMAADPTAEPRQMPAQLKKASDAFLGGMFWDWTPQHHPYIGGGYCSPAARQIADAPDSLRSAYGNGNIFFAGEATTLPGATAHAALESGVRAAAQVNSVLSKSK
jgi:monoamine oxidase/cytochrome b involved in lipid metabolism